VFIVDEHRRALQSHMHWLVTNGASDFLLDQLEYMYIRSSSRQNDWLCVMLDQILIVSRAAAVTVTRESATAASGSCSICYMDFY